MLRTLLFIVLLAIVVLIAVWLATWGGEVALELPGENLDLGVISLAWDSRELTIPFGILVLGVLVVGAIMALLYRLWHALRGTPRRLGSLFAGKRSKRGYHALTQGMVAVAAGEVDEAKKWSRRADDLLDEPPLTHLLAAQAAQLDGDEAAAKRYFTQMLEREDTRFLGLRGLLMQAMREGDEATARGLVRQAYALRPKTPWVLNTLFDLTERAGELEAAEKAVKEAAKQKVLPLAEAQRKQAVLLVERAEAARTSGDSAAALRFAREARRLAPDLVPATALLATLFCAGGRRRDAVRVLERAWGQSPHPSLVTAYKEAQPSADPMQTFKTLGRLVAGRSDHLESSLALGEAALEAELWGEARRHLAKAAESTPDERVCRLMARLEESEHDDSAKSREWLLRISEAPAAPTWVCGSCGTAAAKWSARCGACSAYDGLSWRTPPQVMASAALPPSDGASAPETEAETLLPPEPRRNNGEARTGETVASAAS